MKSYDLFNEFITYIEQNDDFQKFCRNRMKCRIERNKRSTIAASGEHLTRHMVEPEDWNAKAHINGMAHVHMITPPPQEIIDTGMCCKGDLPVRFVAFVEKIKSSDRVFDDFVDQFGILLHGYSAGYGRVKDIYFDDEYIDIESHWGCGVTIIMDYSLNFTDDKETK